MSEGREGGRRADVDREGGVGRDPAGAAVDST